MADSQKAAGTDAPAEGAPKTFVKSRPNPIQIRSQLSPRADLLIGIGGIASLILIWCVATYGGHVKPLFLPTPTSIWESLGEFNKQGWLLRAIEGSVLRVAKSLALVILVGVPVGILMGSFTPIDAFLRKIVNGSKSVPTTGIVGLIVLWFGIEERAKIVFLFLGAIFYMIILVRSAILSVSEDYLKVALDIGANPFQVIRKVLIPGAMPQIWDAFAVCSGIMWTYIVLAEYINGNEEQIGLGYLLNIGSKTQDSGKVFGVLIIVALISSVTDFGLGWFRKRFLNW
ncbi:MAG: ABC transporter permease [Fimbriimonadaceae bacterium]|nr:ABC transporter permease [Fimbriimonadaceae bacterium]